MSDFPPGNETRTYWKLADAGIPGGWCLGYDAEWRRDSGELISSSTSRPAGAETILEPEYDSLMAACLAAGETAANGYIAWKAGQDANRDALLASARAKLVAGDPLTADEAAILTGSL